MPGTDDVFAARFEDQEAPLLVQRVSLRLRTEGMVTLDGLHTRGRVLQAARLLMSVTAHRDSGPDGVTEIRDLGALQDLRGRSGLGPGELLPHTDGAQRPCPPRLMLIACTRAATSGGACLLTDGREVYRSLLRDHPDAREPLEAVRAAFFGDAAGRFSPVFTRLDRGRIRLALRQDEFARFSPAVQPFLPALRDAISRRTETLPLRRGQGYLLDNHRWLHARNAYSGPRLHLRILGDPLPRLALDEGFDTQSAWAQRTDLAPC